MSDSLITRIVAGEPVSPGVTNRPIDTLWQHVQDLRNSIASMEAGAAIYSRNQKLSASTSVGQPVFYKLSEQEFQPAFATLTTDPVTGYPVVPDESIVAGVVAVKHTATSGDVLRFGSADLDITAALESGSPEPGFYYLSASGAGKLVRQKSPVSSFVLTVEGSGRVFVSPERSDFLSDHTHYEFDLVAAPAGNTSPPVEGEPHTIADPDPEVSGWLPSDHASFGGKAPVGAKFGYNLAAHTQLKNLWPPLPVKSAVVVMQRNSVHDSATTPLSNGQQLFSDTVVCDVNGIWWMTDCYDRAPWPTAFDNINSASASLSDSLSENPCDLESRATTLRLYFARVAFATDNAAVTRLQSADPRLKVICSSTGNPASAGSLLLDLDMGFSNGATNTTGDTVIKEYDPETGVLNYGPVTESIYSNSDNLIISSTRQFLVGGKTHHQGRIGLSVVNSGSRELNGQLVRLDGVTEASFPVLYLGFPNTRETSFVVKYDVPSDIPDSSNLRLRLRVLGRAAGTLPNLVLDYYKTQRPSNGLLSPVTVTQSYDNVGLVSSATVAANQAVEALSDAVVVNPGDILYFRLLRDPSLGSDNYTGEVGIMQQVAVVG